MTRRTDRRPAAGRVLLAAVLLASVFPLRAAASAPAAYRNVRIDLPARAGDLTCRAAAVFRRVAEEHAGRRLSGHAGRTLTIDLRLSEGQLPAEAFRIERNDDAVRITASDENGLLYGLGRLLHASSFDAGRFVPGCCEGTSAPDKEFRGIYLATHFGNFYQAAPVAEVERYVEELALWGYNRLLVWFDRHSYEGIGDPAAQRMLQRLAALLRAGRAMGMQTGVTMLANEGYRTTPDSLKARPIGFTDFYGVEICPSAPGGAELILRQSEECLDAFCRLGCRIDQVVLWPYDQGGCACGDCAVWGGNGYLKIARRLCGMIRRKLPDAKITLSTWLFDFREQDKGEWRALADAFDREGAWADYVLADSHTDYPRYLLHHPVPGGLPLLNFPEISMWGNFPWGGYGANPLPGRFQRLWDEASGRVAGGYPYSEGIFEDANKAMYSQFYWDGSRPARQTLRDYVRFEFSAEYADRILEAIDILERNYGGMSSYRWARSVDPDTPKTIDLPAKDHGAAKARRLLEEVDAKLPASVRRSWRWRLLVLRAYLDCELRRTGGAIDAGIDAAFREVMEIQHLENAHFYVRPPVDYGSAYPVEAVHGAAD